MTHSTQSRKSGKSKKTMKVKRTGGKKTNSRATRKQIEKNNNLLAAAAVGNVYKINAALKDGANIEAKNGDGYTSLMLSSWIGEIDAMKALLAANPKPTLEAKSSREEWTALTMAARAGDVEAVNMLLDEGANINTVDVARRTVLMSAAFMDQLDVVNVLLNRGAKIDTRDIAGHTALMLISLHGNDNDSLGIVQALLSAGADPNAATPERHITSLMYAVMEGDESLGIVKALLNAGADPNAATTDTRSTPLIYAVMGSLDVVKELIAGKANVHLKDIDGIGALMLAVEKRDPEIVRELINAGAHVNSFNHDGVSVMQAWGDDPEILDDPTVDDNDPRKLTMSLLLKKNANIPHGDRWDPARAMRARIVAREQSAREVAERELGTRGVFEPHIGDLIARYTRGGGVAGSRSRSKSRNKSRKIGKNNRSKRRRSGRVRR